MRPFCLNAESSLFLMIDIQERLLPAMSNGKKVLSEAERLLRAAAAMEIPVLATEQYPKGLGPTVEPLRSLIKPELTLPKTAFCCFGAEGFPELLARQGRFSVVVFGIESHICVLATAMKLLEHGYDVVVAEEACSSRQKAHHDLAMRNLLAAGAAALPVESVVYQLMYRAGTPLFKSLLPLFK